MDDKIYSTLNLVRNTNNNKMYKNKSQIKIIIYFLLSCNITNTVILYNIFFKLYILLK